MHDNGPDCPTLGIRQIFQSDSVVKWLDEVTWTGLSDLEHMMDWTMGRTNDVSSNS